MNYLIPIVIVAIICAAIYIPSKIKTDPAMWRWTRIYWISFLPLLGLIFIIPNDWPEIIQWSPPLVFWYLAGRMNQQRSLYEYAIKEVRKAARDMYNPGL